MKEKKISLACAMECRCNSWQLDDSVASGEGASNFREVHGAGAAVELQCSVPKVPAMTGHSQLTCGAACGTVRLSRSPRIHATGECPILSVPGPRKWNVRDRVFEKWRHAAGFRSITILLKTSHGERTEQLSGVVVVHGKPREGIRELLARDIALVSSETDIQFQRGSEMHARYLVADRSRALRMEFSFNRIGKSFGTVSLVEDAEDLAGIVDEVERLHPVTEA
jgi:hypothetical protein